MQSLLAHINHLPVITILPLVISHIQVPRLSQTRCRREEKGDAELMHPPRATVPSTPAATARFPATASASPTSSYPAADRAGSEEIKTTTTLPPHPS